MPKLCRKCGSEGPFWTNRVKKDGQSIYCIVCDKKRLKKYRRSKAGRMVSRRYRQSVKGSPKEKASRFKTVRRLCNRFRMNMALARRRGKSWTIPIAEYEKLIKLPCRYCGGPLPETSFGLDRIDNSKGYDQNNVVPCCSLCNYARRDQFTHGEMILFIGPAVRKIREWRDNPTPDLLLEQLGWDQ